MAVETKDRESEGGNLPSDNRASRIDNDQSAEPWAFSVARLLLIATLLGAPLAFGAVIPWAWTALGLAGGLGLFLWALGSVQQGAVKLIWSPLYIPLAMFLLLGAVQYGARLTLDTSETRQALVLLVTDLLFFFLATQLFGAGRSATLRPFGLAVLVFAGGMGLFAILQTASGMHRIYGIVETPGGGFFGPYVNRDHFAGLMEMLLPVAVLYVVGRHGKFSLEASVWCLSAVALALAALLLSGSRSGLLALSVEIAVAAAALRRAGAWTRQRRRLTMAAALTLVVGVMLFAYVDPGWVAKKLGSVAYVDKTWADWASDRKSMARDALSMWRAHPLLGVGMGDFETAYPRYQSFPSDLWIDHAHNDYVEAAAETGLVGALLILSALALFLRLAFRDWGHPLSNIGRTDGAIAHYQKALEINPNYAKVHNNFGNLLSNIGRTNEAIAHYRKALEINPNYFEAHNNLGNLLANIGRTDEAIAHYLKALEINPNCFETHYNLGNLLSNIGRTDEAIAHYQQALEINPDKINTLQSLAEAFVRKGQVTQAISVLQRALALAKSAGDEPLASEIAGNLEVLYTASRSSQGKPR